MMYHPGLPQSRNGFISTFPECALFTKSSVIIHLQGLFCYCITKKWGLRSHQSHPQSVTIWQKWVKNLIICSKLGWTQRYQLILRISLNRLRLSCRSHGNPRFNPAAVSARHEHSPDIFPILTSPSPQHPPVSSSTSKGSQPSRLIFQRMVKLRDTSWCLLFQFSWCSPRALALSAPRCQSVLEELNRFSD